MGTYDKEGKANFTTCAWVGPVSSEGPKMFISLQKPRHAFANMKENDAFTICVIPCENVAAADACGMCSGAKVDKFEMIGAKPLKSAKVNAPYCELCTQVYECKLAEVKDLGMHTSFIGEVVGMLVRKDCLDENGQACLASVDDPIFFAPQGVYAQFEKTPLQKAYQTPKDAF